MTANDLQTVLQDLLQLVSEQHVCDDSCRADGCDAAGDDRWDDLDAGALAGCSVRTFDADGCLTSDAGLVVRLAGGREFQITIVRSR